MSKPRTTSWRLDYETDRLLDALAKQKGLTRTDIIRLAVRMMAKKELGAEKQEGKP